MDRLRSTCLMLLLSLLCATSITDGEEGTPPNDTEGELGTSASLTSDSSPKEALEPGKAVAHQVASPGLVSATEPYIDPATPLHVTAYANVPALIRCLVNNLGQRSVSWVRHHDIHVLTVGRFTFTNDDRFEVQHDDGSNEWVLKLRAPTVNDSGTYECQINTKPTISQLISLKVLEPKAVITVGTELYLQRGSTLRLTCKVTNAPSTSDFLLWYHEEKVANYEMDQVEVNVEGSNGTTISTLALVDAQPANSGTYTCSPSNATPASVRVHVLSGEHPAAMQTNAASLCFRCNSNSSPMTKGSSDDSIFSIAQSKLLRHLWTSRLAPSLAVVVVTAVGSNGAWGGDLGRSRVLTVVAVASSAAAIGLLLQGAQLLLS